MANQSSQTHLYKERDNDKMRKSMDITEKLELDGNPCLIIKGEEYEVNADAATMLKIMGEISNVENQGEEGKVEHVFRLYNLIFPEETRKKFEENRIGFHDLNTIIEFALDLIAGKADTVGEKQPHAMT